MGLKEKLMVLPYQQIYKVWQMWIQQNAELPNEGQMAQELSDMVFHDPGVEAELLSDVDNAENLAKICSDMTIEQKKLLDFLQTSYNEYKADVLPLCPAPNEWKHFHHKEQEFDHAKNEFLESLWDVIRQHFDDQK